MIKVMKKNCAVANLNKLLTNFLNWQFRPPPPPPKLAQHHPRKTTENERKAPLNI